MNPIVEDQIDSKFDKYKNRGIHANTAENTEANNKKNKMQLDSDEDDDQELMKALDQKAKQNPKSAMKRAPESEHIEQQIKYAPKRTNGFHVNHSANPEKMECQPKKANIRRSMTFSQLPEEIVFYLTEVVQFSFYKLFITGVMQNGHTISIVANETQREMYFALKKEQLGEETLSKEYQSLAEKQITQTLYSENIRNFVGEFEDRQYVFELENICREKRPYFKVRYPFSTKETPAPDLEGKYFEYVFGTTYTPLEIFLLNTKIKGPCWVKIQKECLKENRTNVDRGVCANIDFAEFITPVREMTRPPTLRVMSISLKSAIPAQLARKALFTSNRIDESHIYCISYTYSEDYMVEIKPAKYNIVQKTFYLKEFGKLTEPNYFQCQTEKQMIAEFLNDVKVLDPDVLACHDSAKILDVLVQRMTQLSDKSEKARLGRLIHFESTHAHNQHQRLSNAVSGRLLADTYVHSKDMIKSIDYELESMSLHIKPERNFVGMNDEQVKSNLDAGKTFAVIRKVREQSEITFAILNHLQVLQLTRQLSNICGNLWRRSLENQRAERNEYLIMHECIERGLIIPDKFKSNKNLEEQEEADRKKYVGGMVLEPKKGMYNDYILLLDFNSLYPSIIREYNICFSVLERPKMPLSKYYRAAKKVTKEDKAKKNQEKADSKNNHGDEDDEIQPPPREQCVREKWGFLPHLIDTIVSQRKKCKKAMKTATPERCIILDIQQKSYKIVANSIYGCLGFSISRFYSKPMAALITRMGREALQKANDIVSAKGGVSVIYGDTDSLMIQPTNLNKETEVQKLFEIKAIADDLKKAINSEYMNLEIDIDGIFKPIILLMKKKYVANKLVNFDKIMAKIDQKPEFHLEYKGIEVVRRDGCEIARNSLKAVLQILMKTEANDHHEIYEKIYEKAAEIKDRLPNLGYKDFLFSKQLSKKPSEYHRPETIPHVKVALDRIKNGEREQTLVNHTIYYLVIKAKLESQDTLAKRCVDDRSFERAQKFGKTQEEKFEIDYDYYKEEILQPWMRIFMHLEDFNIDKLFESFGVESSRRTKLKKFIEKEKEDVQNDLENFLTNDMKAKSEKFNQQIGEVTCPKCSNTMNLSEDGKFLTNCKYCQTDSSSKWILNTLSNKISQNMRSRCATYYNNKFKCECKRQFALTPISKCCRVQSERKTVIPFEMHTFVYMCKELCEHTLNKLKVSGEQTKDSYRRVSDINEKILDRFLRESDFENIEGIASCFEV